MVATPATAQRWSRVCFLPGDVHRTSDLQRAALLSVKAVLRGYPCTHFCPSDVQGSAELLSSAAAAQRLSRACLRPGDTPGSADLLSSVALLSASVCS